MKARNLIDFHNWVSTLLCCLLLCLLSLTDAFNATSQLLVRHEVTKSNETGAVCNDGSPAIYYMYENKNFRKWVIYLEGGGGCNSQEDCQKRFKIRPYFMSSKLYPEYAVPKTIMADPEFDEYNKVLMVYCSSDSWLGDDRNIKKAKGTFVFRGSVIFSTIILELMEKGLRNANDVILIGQSAGGLGVMNHLQFTSSILPINCKLSAVLDSSWFINFENYFNTNSNIDFMKSSGLINRDACKDISWGFPCCFSMSCLISNSYVPPDVSLFILQSKYDIYVLFQRFLQQHQHFDNILNSQDILIKVHSYGGRMRQSFDIVDTNRNINYVFPSCFQHGYLVSSDLWYKVYNPEINLEFPSVHFKHSMNETYWTTINIKGNTLRQSFVTWMRGRLQLNHTIQINDVCLHAQCNPSCPRLIQFDPYEAPWSFSGKAFLIAIVLFITIGCLVTKCMWIMQHRSLKKTQALYLNNNYEGGQVFEKVMCLPTCPPHSSIGISCRELQYDITTFQNAETGTLLRNPDGVTNESRKLRIRRRSVQTLNKKLIKGVTAYFNPGQLVAIMGPSGSGKTTLLDVITARKHYKEAEANIFINGLPAEETREWFIKNSGYVLQLATPYHEELTVRQNLTYSAVMRLPMKMKMQDKMWRVEQVLGQCGLYDVADVVVGDNSLTGGGLSGGQKRRLCIALQLLDLPSVIFLDEPTSGLDSASSLELLETLHGLTLSGRLVVITIHQPRIEIFHMFDTILFLCDGQVAYFGSPVMAPTMISEALKDSDQKFDASNPADSFMDVLTNPESQKLILDYYLQSGEIQSINRAISRARRHPQKTLSMKFQKQTSSIQNRLLALDGRSAAAQTPSQMFYFPLIYLLYGLALGTCYWKTEKGVLLMSCYMVFSCASQLFLASVIHAHLHKAFALFELEKADGVGHSVELVLHVFIRTFSKSSLPLIMSCVIIYLCTITDYVLWKFCLTTLIHLQLNQTWIAIIIFTACSTQRYSSLVTPLLSAVAGFAGGFLVPEPQMPMIYYWLFYINPTHWAYSGMMKVLINDAVFECKWNSPLECQGSNGIVVLSEFGFSKRNPYVSMLVLFFMLVLFLLLSVIVLEIKYSKRKWDKRKKSYWQAVRQSVTSCYQSFMENYNRKKREAEEEERERLFQLVKEQYRYKNGAYDSATAQPIKVTYEPLKDRSMETGLDVSDMRDERRNTMASNKSEDTCDETENSSNDEDIDPTVDGNKKRLSVHNTQSQHSSFTSIFTKLHFGLSSKSNSIDNNNDNQTTESVRYRKKRRNWRKKIAHRRKTFTGFIKEDEEIVLPTDLKRPRSMLLPLREGGNGFNKIKTDLNSSNSNSVENSPRTSRGNTFSSVTTVIERKHPVPPDIVIDIENIKPKQEEKTETSLTIDSLDPGKSISRPISRTSVNRNTEIATRKKKKKKEPKSKDTWSKYLDASPKRHEVYCALNSVKKRLRGSGRGLRGALKKSESVLLQRKASTLILNEKRDSMRTQLSGFVRRAYYSGTDNVDDYSPATMKRIIWLKAREKYLKSNSDDEVLKGAEGDEPATEMLAVNNAEGVVVPRDRKKRLTGDRALLERLSALSSHRSSARSSLGNTLSSKRSSHTNSGYNLIDPVADMIPPNTTTSVEIYNVLKKLHTSIDEMDTDDINMNQADSIGGLNQTANVGDRLTKHRDSDPLLPNERDLIEEMLLKYRHLTPGKPLESGNRFNEQAVFSSKVKIRGNSPHPSRRTSEDRTKMCQPILSSYSNKGDLIAEEMHVEVPSDVGKEELTEKLSKKPSLLANVDSVDSGAKVSTPNLTPRSAARKVSTVKEYAKMYEEETRRLNEPKFTIVPEQKYYDVSSDTDSVSESSSSSEYEDEMIVKTNEGFIIPDDAIDKLNKLNINKARKAQRLREEQEEIERQFKKENFLKDRPARRGIRMPVGSAGKVNQLKSKFEGKLLANAMVSEIKQHGGQSRNSTNLANSKDSEQWPTPQLSHHGKQRMFFKKRRQMSKSTDTNSESEETSEMIQLKNLTAEPHFDESWSLLQRYHDSIVNNQENDFEGYDFDIDSSERDIWGEYRHYNRNEPDYYDYYSTSEDESKKLDTISIYSCSSDRKRKHYAISRDKDCNDKECWI